MVLHSLPLKEKWQLVFEVSIYFSVLGALTDEFIAVERIKNKKAATDRIHILLDEPMTSLFSQASPSPYTSPLSTPPPSPSRKRKRDQTLSPGGN